MLDDIRELYLKVLLDTLVKPALSQAPTNDITEIGTILRCSLNDLETRVRECVEGNSTGAETVYLQSPPFEAFKYRLRDTESFVMHKYRERARSRLNSVTDSVEDVKETDVAVLAFRDYHSKMVNGIQLGGTKLLDQLVQDHCLEDSDVESINCKPTDRKKNEQLLHFLSTRLSGEKIMNSFLPALHSEHEHLADGFRNMLQENYQPAARQCPHCRMKGKVDPTCVAEILYRKSLITENELRDYRTCLGWTEEKWNRILERVHDCSVIVDALQVRYPDFHKELVDSEVFVNIRECTCNCSDALHSDADIISMDSYSTTQSVESTVPSYPMASSTRGICVIIHNTKESQDLHCDSDTDKVEKLFSGFGFAIERFTDLTQRLLYQRLYQMSVMNHSNYDAFVCVVVLAGTDKDHVLDARGEAVAISSIVSPFRTTKCPTLAGKPKLFLFPYASGYRRTPALLVKELPVSQFQLETRRNVVPEDADMLYARGTLPGCTTSCCKRTGSWYLNNLIDVMDKHGDTLDFVSCLAMVNDGVSRVEYAKNDAIYTQTSHLTSTLRKALFFRKRPRSRSKQSHEEMELASTPKSKAGRV